MEKEQTKKEQIIEAARELFTTYGYRKVSMDEIARKSKVTKKTIYSYFKDKDELYEFFVLEEIGNMRKIIEENEKLDLSFINKLHKTIYELLKYRRNAKFIVMLSKEVENESIKQSLKMLDGSIKNYIREKLETAIEEKYIKKCDIDVAAFLIYKIYESLILEWSNTENPLDEKQITDNLIRILKDGIFYEDNKKEEV